MKNEDAQIIFLNEIEKNTTAAADATTSLVKELSVLTDAFVKAIEKQTMALAPKDYPEPKPIDLSAVVNSTLSVANTVLQSGNKSNTILVRQVESLLESNRAIIAQLETLNKPKKWKFNIDRNFTTGLIQGVIAEVIIE